MKMVAIIAPIVIVGAVVGLGMSGVVNIPRLSPAKHKTKSADGDDDATKTDSAEVASDGKAADDKSDPKADAPAPKTVKASPPAATTAKVADATDPAKGIKKLAAVWNEMAIADMVKITASWKDSDLVKVLVVMDAAKVAEYLTAVAAKNATLASNLSKALQKEASLTTKPAAPPAQ